MNRPIPIIFDEIADPKFGTGVVKVTPAHDPNDLEAGKRHDLPQIKVIGEDAHMTAEAGPYAGLDRFEARKRIVADLEKQGLLEKVEPYTLALSKCDRCGTIVEPLISTQWFVKTKPLAEKAMAAVNEGRIQFVPDNWNKTFFNWMENIRDWCISRQLWWGHRIPAWHCAQLQEDHGGSRSSQGCVPTASRRDLTQDPDVLDTWFSSSLWPFSTLGWPDDTDGSARILSDHLDDHRLRHPVLLGGAHDDDGHRAHRRRSVPPGAHAWPGARSRAQEDVEDQGQRGRPARHQRASTEPTPAACGC